ncbi:MAG: hypothetical protein ACQESR_10555 [Planctomycetota bacterium]
MFFFQSVHDPQQDAKVLRRRAYGVICIEDERLQRILLRPWPKLSSVPEIVLLGTWFHDRASGNRCWLYYNQPFQHRNFLALRYVVSSRYASFRTFRGALVVLDEIARIKQSDAIVCEVSNPRISDRLLRRWGWERHVHASRRRHFIKRFYGTYPDPGEARRLIPDKDRKRGQD